MTTHPRGIAPYRDRWRVYVTVRGVYRSRVFPAETSPAELQAERDILRGEVQQELAGRTVPKASKTETLRAGALRYLAAVTALPTYRARVRDIALWVDRLGDRPRLQISPTEIRAIRDEWLTVGPRLVQTWKKDPKTGRRKQTFRRERAPLSASTVNHRLRALENLYTVLDGRHAWNPVRDVPEAEEGEQPPRTVPLALIRRILAAMPDSAAKARLSVLAWTGIPPASLKRIDAEMVDWERKAVWVPRRQKGKGAKGAWLPLTSDGLAAFRALEQRGAWGRFSWDNVRRAFHAACKGLKVRGLRPYDFRHAMAARVLESVGDFRTAQVLLQHASPETTARYASAAVDPHLAAAVARLEQAEQVGRKSATLAQELAQAEKPESGG